MRLDWIASIFLLLTASTALAAFPVPVVERTGDLLVNQWTTDNGLPQNTITSIVQTRDRYLWVGTFGGLARFDGISFTIFDAASTPALTSNRVLSLFEDSHGTLWIGAETGEVFFLKDLQFRELDVSSETGRSAVWDFEEAKDGNLYISSNTGLEAINLDEKGDVVPDSHRILTTRQSSTLVKSPSGTILAKVGREIFIIENDSLVPAADLGMQFPSIPLQIAFVPDGRAFVGAMGTLGIVDRENYTEFLRLFYRTHRSGISLAVHNGKFWFQQAGELFEFTEGSGIRYDLTKYIEGGSRALFFDTEGNLWIGTQYNGLVKLARREVELLSRSIGQMVEGVYSLAQDPTGAIWIAAGEQLLRLHGNNVRKIDGVGRPDGLPVARSLAVDSNGTVWVGGTNGLFFLRNDRLVPIEPLKTKHIHALFFDDRHRLWVGAADGLGVLEDGTLKNFTVDDGLADNSVHFITQTHDGSIWVGTFRGISVIKDGKFKNLTTEDGLTANYVRDIVEDTDGTMWFATYGGGITRFRDGRMSPIRRTEGLPNNFVSRIIVDQGRFWIVTNVGIIAVDRDVMNAVADGRSPILAGSKYDKADGMPSSEANGGHQAAGIKTSNGQLWFPMLQDVVIIDPGPRSGTPPAIVIENAATKAVSGPERSSSTVFDASKPFEIENGLRNLEIRYTGLSFQKPDEIRFFYRLDGLDDDWIDAGNRRTAFYPYLPAGSYEFHVKALNADGIWSQKPASLQIIVQQRFWETRWFLISAVLAIVAVAGIFVHSRTRRKRQWDNQQVEFTRRMINAQEIERQRFAAELHDGLGQNLLLIKNWAQLGRSNKKDPKSLVEYLGKIEGTASNSIEEAREIAQHLSPQILKRFGLTEAIVNIVDQIGDATEVSIETRIDNIDGLFDKEVELYIYRIVQECLNNLVSHSLSVRGKLYVRKLPESVTIIIQDFGKGFDVESVLDRHEVSGFGLPSIAERVRLIGGELSIRSVPDQGTRIRVELNLNGAQNEKNENPDRG